MLIEVFAGFVVFMATGWFVLAFVGYMAGDRRCPRCKGYSNKDRMIRDNSGKYWHHPCIPLHQNNKSYY